MRRVLLAASLAVPGIVWGESPFALRETAPGSLELSENGKPVFVYNYGMQLANGAPESYRRSGYLHPVYAPGGTIVTDDFPRDHYHHRGLFWAWPVVNIDGTRHDMWLVKDVRQKFVRWIDRSTGDRSARIAAENEWIAGGRKVAKEFVEITVKPAEGSRREFELAVRIEALDKAVELSGSPDGKGYGGIDLRFAPRKDTVVTTDAGVEAKDTDMVPHPWAELEGTFGNGKRAGARIDIDPSTPGYPDGWCLRNYGFLGVNYPGLKTHKLEPGKPLALKVRITLFSK